MDTPTDSNPFTPQKVHDILREKVLKDGPLPPVDDLAIVHLARALTTLRWMARGWAGPWPKELEQLEKIAEAIQILTDVLPELRKATAATLARFKCRDWDGLERQDMTLEAQHVEADVAAYDALITAARAARERGLPITLEPMIVMSKRIDCWKDFAKQLQAIFQTLLPKADSKSKRKLAAYRLIEAVAPDITGDAPTFGAIKTAFEKKRLCQ